MTQKPFINFIVLKIEDRNGDIYQINTHGKNKCMIEEPAQSGVLGKNRTCLVYQSMTHMVKMEPERYTIIVDNGDLVGYTHMPVHTLDGILNMYLYFVETGQKHWIDLSDRFWQETVKTCAYNEDHNIRANYYTGWDKGVTS
jgi:hypothetical protein